MSVRTERRLLLNMRRLGRVPAGDLKHRDALLQRGDDDGDCRAGMTARTFAPPKPGGCANLVVCNRVQSGLEKVCRRSDAVSPHRQQLAFDLHAA